MTSKQNKRPRATNFSFAEKELLLKYAIENRHILENKESNSVSWKNKNKCWLEISEKYNSTTTGCPRDATSLRLKYEGVKKLLRGHKNDLFITGGGPYKNTYSSCSELEKQLYEIIQLSVEGLPSLFDSDATNVSHTAEESKTQNEAINESIDMFTDYIIVKDDNICIVDQINESKTSLSDNWTNDTMVEKNTEQTINQLYYAKNPFIENDLLNLPSTSNEVNNKPSWTPMDSTKLLKTAGKHKKLTNDNLKRKNNCQTSVSKKFILLAEKKIEVVEIQKSILTEELNFMKTKHALEIKSLEIDISIKMQKLDNNETN